MVLWGKSKEAKRLTNLTPSGNSKDVNGASNVMETVPMAPTSFSINVDESDKLPVNSPRKELKDQEIVEDI